MIDIRVAAVADRPAVEAIVQAAYAVYVPRIGRKPAPMLDDYAALIRENRVHVLSSDGVLLGMAVLIPEDASMLLETLAVSPRVQRLGYGRKLLEFAESYAIDSGFDSIRLYTNEAMTENIAWYTRTGFVETDRREENGFQRVYMTKRLK